MADNMSIDTNQQHQQQLYYSIVRLNNSDNTLNAWMRHILSYLTSSERHHNNNNHYLGLHQLRRNHNHDRDQDDDPLERPELQLQLQVQMQEPHVAQGAVCDGSSDCQSNLWAHEVSYEQHYRKLLMSRVNAGDTNQVNSVDQESLRREASLVMESVDPARPPQQPALGRENVNAAGADDANTPMDVESFSESRYSDWDFVMYDSDVESSDDLSDDPTYEISESDLIKLDDDYTSASDDDTDYDSDRPSDSYELISTASLRYDDGYSSGNSERTSKYRRVSCNVAGAAGRIDTDTESSVFEYYYCTSDEDDSEEYVRSESEWEDVLSSN